MCIKGLLHERGWASDIVILIEKNMYKVKYINCFSECHLKYRALEKSLIDVKLLSNWYIHFWKAIIVNV